MKKRDLLKVIALLLIAVMMFSLAGCGGDSKENADKNSGSDKNTQTKTYNVPEVPSLTFTTDTLPSIDGATALAPYYEAAAAKVLQMDVEEARAYTMCSKTDGAYENLIDGTADIIFCSMPSDEQKQMAKDAGVTFETTPFLNGGFVFFVNKDNPVDSLTLQQYKDIYSGKITNWKEVGGNDEPVIAYQRSENSGSQNGMYEYIIGKDEIMKAPVEKVIETMEGIVDAVANYDNASGAIGYSYYYYVVNMHYNDQIKLLAVNGVLPSDETIANGTYPIINPSLMIINADTPKDSPIRDFIKWVCSDEGKQIAVDNGYIPRED